MAKFISVSVSQFIAVALARGSMKPTKTARSLDAETHLSASRLIAPTIQSVCQCAARGRANGCGCVRV